MHEDEKTEWIVWFTLPNGSRSGVESFDKPLDALKRTNELNIKNPSHKYVMIPEKRRPWSK